MDQPPKQAKTRVVPVRYTSIERDALKAAARKAGISVSGFIREVTVSRALRVLGEHEEANET